MPNKELCMVTEVDPGRVAFALAQTTLSMLVASGVLDERTVKAAADDIEEDRDLGLSAHEAGTLADILRSSSM